ncbi:MAG: MFS transporter [Chloroflexi bacterium]|nr:MFS transporter [Chloroflexota bacterium]
MDKIESTATDDAKPLQKGLSYKWLALITVAIGQYMATLDTSIVNISFPILTKAFRTSPSTILWVSVAYFLASTSLLLTLGKMGDVLGRKRIYTLGFVIFTIGLALCAVAQNAIQLILFRVVQGVGASMIIANGIAIVTDAFPSSERGKAVGITAAVVSTGLASGPTLGGILIDVLDWRSIFYLRLPVGIAGTFMAWHVLKEKKRSNINMSFDIKGALLLSAGLIALLTTINRGPTLGLTSPSTLAMGLATLAILLVFVFLELRTALPVLELRLFKNRLFAAANTSYLLNFLAYSTYTFIVPFYLMQARGFSATKAGLFMTVVPLSRLVTGPISGRLYDKLGSQLLCTIGISIVAVGLILLGGLDVNSSNIEILSRLMILGLGSGIFEPPNTSSIMGSVSRDRLGTASAMVATSRQIGLASGVAIGGTIFTSRQLYHASHLSTEGVSGAALQTKALVLGFHDAILITVVFALIAIATSSIRGGEERTRPVQRI